MSETVWGSDGLNVNAAANPAAMTDLGLMMEDITVAPQTPSTLSSVMQAIGAFFGVSQALAQAASAGIYSKSSGIASGYIMLDITRTGPMSLSAALQALGAKIERDGRITNSAGTSIGRTFGGLSGANLSGLEVRVDTVTGPVLLDQTVSAGTLTDGAGNSWPIGGWAPEVWGEATQVGGCNIVSPAQRAWDSTGINNPRGVPLMDYNNIVAMFHQQNSFVLPGIIGGKDGLYSLRTGKPLVLVAPGTPRGFSIGRYADYTPTYLLLAGSAQGRYVLLGQSGDAINVIDPSTGRLLVPAAYAWLVVYNGSQQMNLLGYPGYSYTGPAPSSAAPGFNLAAGVTPTAAITQLSSANWAVAKLAAWLALNPGRQPGDGSEGGAQR